MSGVVYIIKNGDCTPYIGSTTQDLRERYWHHKSHKTCTSHVLFEMDTEPTIEVLEECDTNNLRIRERYWIENTECINIKVPGRTWRERRANDKYKEKYNGYMREYRDRDREKYNAYMREFRKRKYECPSCGKMVSIANTRHKKLCNKEPENKREPTKNNTS